MVIKEIKSSTRTIFSVSIQDKGNNSSFAYYYHSTTVFGQSLFFCGIREAHFCGYTLIKCPFLRNKYGIFTFTSFVAKFILTL